MGVLFMMSGAYPVFAGLHVYRNGPVSGDPPWVMIAAGSMFILAGLDIINSYGVAGRSQVNGDLSADAPFIARVTQYVLGIAIVGLMFAVFAWISFGPGERHFSSSISIPGLSSSTHSSDRSGRIAFGIATVVMGLFFVLSTIAGAKRLWLNSRRSVDAS